MKELEKHELIVLNGGTAAVSKLLKGGFWGTAIWTIIDHWVDIKSGIVEGWRDGMKD